MSCALGLCHILGSAKDQVEPCTIQLCFCMREKLNADNVCKVCLSVYQECCMSEGGRLCDCVPSVTGPTGATHWISCAKHKSHKRHNPYIVLLHCRLAASGLAISWQPVMLLSRRPLHRTQDLPETLHTTKWQR